MSSYHSDIQGFKDNDFVFIRTQRDDDEIELK